MPELIPSDPLDPGLALDGDPDVPARPLADNDHGDLIIATDADPDGRQYMLHKVVGLEELTEVIRELTAALTGRDVINPGFPAFLGDGDTYRDAITQRTWTYTSQNGWELTQDDIKRIRRT